MSAAVRHLAPVGAKPTRCCDKTRAELGPGAVFEYDVALVNCGIYGTAYARHVNAEWARAEADYLAGCE